MLKNCCVNRKMILSKKEDQASVENHVWNIFNQVVTRLSHSQQVLISTHKFINRIMVVCCLFVFNQLKYLYFKMVFIFFIFSFFMNAFQWFVICLFVAFSVDKYCAFNVFFFTYLKIYILYKLILYFSIHQFFNEFIKVQQFLFLLK